LKVVCARYVGNRRHWSIDRAIRHNVWCNGTRCIRKSLRRPPLARRARIGPVWRTSKGGIMLRRWIPIFSFVLSAALCSTAALSQGNPAPAPSAYAIPIGPGIGLDGAKKVAAATSAEARKNKWFMAIAVVDPAGTLVYFEKADTTQNGSANVAINKARSAALYKRPTKAFQDALEKGGIGVRVLALEGAVPVEGGVPLLVDGKLVGAVGVSGDLSEHDAQCATAGAAALTAPAAR
jgi:glc operon protein GlcG